MYAWRVKWSILWLAFPFEATMREKKKLGSEPVSMICSFGNWIEKLGCFIVHVPVLNWFGWMVSMRKMLNYTELQLIKLFGLYLCHVLLTHGYVMELIPRFVRGIINMNIIISISGDLVQVRFGSLLRISFLVDLVATLYLFYFYFLL